VMFMVKGSWANTTPLHPPTICFSPFTLRVTSDKGEGLQTLFV